jgi:anion-transporting  ArsA/GET3 family ATPase
MSRVIVCIGAGGVGKTTVAAALGLAAARAGRRALVLTIDPAHRLVDALGLDSLGVEPRRVAAAAGSLDAMQLDQKVAWDRLVARHAPSPEAAHRLLENRVYRGLSQSFAGTHEYLAVEALCALVEEGRYDLLVLDTPPADQAFAFLEAPARLRGLLDARLVQLLLGGRRFLPAWRALLRRAEAATGSAALADLADFFAALSSFFDVVEARAREVDALLHDARTAIVLVAAADDRSLATATAAASRLGAIGLAPSAIVVNRLLAPDLEVEGEPPPRARVLAELAAAGLEARAAWLADNYLAYRRHAAGEAARARAIAATAPGATLVPIPNLGADVHDLDSLGDLARRLSAAGAISLTASPPA